MSHAGVLFALGAALGWAGYVLLTQRVGDHVDGFDGLAISITTAALCVAPLVDFPSLTAHASPISVLIAGGVALLLPVLPYACEMTALRTLTSSAFGILMGLEPAVGLLVGLIVLRQIPDLAQCVGVALVITAGSLVARQGHRSE